MLRTGRSQLPDDRPGAVLLKIPEQWTESSGLVPDIVDVCKEFLRGTKRIVCVGVYVEGWHESGTDIFDWMGGFEVLNPDHKFDPTLDWKLASSDKLQPGQARNWRKLTDFFNSVNA